MLSGTWLHVFFFYILISGILTGKALSESGTQTIANNSKLLSARQLLIEGTDCLHNNHNQQAKVKLANACAIAPDLPQAHHQLGIALAKLGENEEAMNEFSTAIKLDPNIAASWLNLAAVYQTSGDIGRAKTTYQEFISRFPQDKDISKIRALVESLNASASAFSKPNTTNEMVNEKQSLNSNTISDTVKSEFITQGAPNSLNKKIDSDYYADISRRGVWLWPKDRMPLKVYIERAKPSNGASAQYVSILKDAFRDWSADSHGLLNFAFVEAINKADIICSWSKDLSKFKNSNEAANAKVYAKNGALDKGEIEILTLTVADARPITDNQVRSTSLHEIGHILGLTGHSSDPGDVMYISASLKDAWAKLSNRDINTIVRLYSINGQ